MLDGYEKHMNVIEFLGQIKSKIDDTSRCYTATWTLDMLHKSIEDNKKNKSALPEAFTDSVKKLQAEWDAIITPLREQRFNILGTKCIQFFYSNYPEAYTIIPYKQVKTFGPTAAAQWKKLSEKLHQAANGTPEYSAFIGKLMVEMVIY